MELIVAEKPDIAGDREEQDNVEKYVARAENEDCIVTKNHLTRYGLMVPF